MVEELVAAGVTLASAAVVYVAAAARVVKQYERGWSSVSGSSGPKCAGPASR